MKLSNLILFLVFAGGGFGAGKSKVPAYAAAFEGNAPFGGVSDLSLPMESNQGAGGYVKR